MDTVIVERLTPTIALVTMNRPERLNAMTHELVADLHRAFAQIKVDRECRAVILTGAGRGFCAGLDLTGTGPAPHADGWGPAGAGMKAQQHIAKLIPHMRSVPQPIIAAVNGPASGGGLALALGSDVRVAATSAKFNVAFVRIGLSGCDIGVSWLLPRIVGLSKAFEMSLTGRLVDAAEAEAMGLVSRVVPDGEVVDAAREIAELIAANSPFGVWMTKEVMWSNLETGSLQAAIDLENRTQILSSTTGDMREAVTAFFEKRPPEFRHG